jgi:hypothetical protein
LINSLILTQEFFYLKSLKARMLSQVNGLVPKDKYFVYGSQRTEAT